LRLAEEAAAAGVRHFIFLSTIGVHGSTSQDGPLTEVSPIRPESPYAETKARAEEGLLAIAQRTGLAVTIIRPVLVYGPEVKGNFASLARLVRSGMPLPLKSVRNRRAFLGIDNLTSLVLHRIMAASSGTETLIAADDERVSTPDFIRMLAAALGRRALLMPLPPDLLRATLLAMGRKATANSLLESLDVNCAVAWRLGWRPAIALQDGLHDAVRALARHPTAAPSSLAH
jgi:UDP-glucose 4-epimerase